jgi:hypothetical protein
MSVANTPAYLLKASVMIKNVLYHSIRYTLAYWADGHIKRFKVVSNIENSITDVLPNKLECLSLTNLLVRCKLRTAENFCWAQ